MVDLPGGIVLEKLKNPDFPHIAQYGGLLPFCALYIYFFLKKIKNFSMGGAEQGQSTGWPVNWFIGPRSGPHPASILGDGTF